MCFYMVEVRGIEPRTLTCKASAFPITPYPHKQQNSFCVFNYKLNAFYLLNLF